jgi:L-amino acid N-acyltransferase YncA
MVQRRDCSEIAWLISKEESVSVVDRNGCASTRNQITKNRRNECRIKCKGKCRIEWRTLVWRKRRSEQRSECRSKGRSEAIK